jgi:hypothetical protein
MSTPPYLSSLSAAQNKVKDVQEFTGPTAGASQSKYTRQSTSFNFLNSDIARDRGRPNAFSKETSSSIYGGAIGEN